MWVYVPTCDTDYTNYCRDKNPVVALREIAENKLDLEQTKETLAKGLQKYHEEVLTEPEVEEDNKEQIIETPELSEDIIEDVEENASEAGLSIDENS